MVTQTRRRFLMKTSAIGALTTLSGLAAACAAQPASAAAPLASPAATAQPTSAVPTTSLPNIRSNGPIVAYVNDLSSGEVTILVGTQEYVYRDPGLVASIVKAIH